MSIATTAGNRAILYCRVSSKMQEGNESLAGQEKLCRRYAESAGYEVIAIERDVMSGARMDRPGLGRVRELLRREAASHLIVWKLDRLSRADDDDVDAVLMARELKKLGVRIHQACTGRPYGDSPQDELLLGIEKVVARYERRNIAERAAMGRRQKVERGAYLGNGLAPYGYRRVGEKKNVQLEIEPNEAAVVEDIFTWFVVGSGEGPLTAGTIVDCLRARGVPTPAEKLGRQDRRRKSGDWAQSSVYDILKHPVYKGKWPTYRLHKQATRTIERPDSDRVYVDVPAIVHTDLWQAAQDKLAQGRAMSLRNTKHEYLVARRIECKCGYKWHGVPCHADGKVYLYYKCISRNLRLVVGPDCRAPQIRARKLDALVWDWLLDLLQDDERLRADLERRQRQADKEKAEVDAAIADEMQRVHSIEQQLDRLLDGFTQGIVKASAYEKKSVELEHQKAIHEARVEKLEQRAGVVLSSATIQTVCEYAAELRGKAAAADFDTKRFLVDVLGVNVAIGQDENGGLYADVSCEMAADRLQIVSGTSCMSR